ncbi:NAD(P)-dependent oxidoreductase [Roseiterribacter gracilis]|uniref:Oxidoreductase n=1 Tax=Roseiterribacter gracilis TaxID=2812848 RepID=A0A8S8XBI4_9PROT|nr:oxidoreductase [Rhodospirillales bacterium TMPK1]
MATKMLTFTQLDRETPEKRTAAERREDFGEIYREYAKAQAEAQASRCSQCGVPFCQVHCPLGNFIPDWLKLTAENRLQEAYEISASTNTFPEICGRICPQDRLCEGNCTIEQSGHGTVTIGSVERFITETAFEEGWVTPRMPLRERAQSVGIVGAGPAGLAAAEALRADGYKVTVYDRYDRVGGLLIYGIPNFKLEKTVVQRREALLRAQGVEFRLNFEVGRDATLDELRGKHDAVLVAAGVYEARPLRVPGVGAKNVVAALDYLTSSNKRGLGDAVEAEGLDASGKRVVVIGGGDTAMDCVRTAVRQGASAVTCLYRRDRANMPGSQREVAHAEEEGVVFEWLAAPQSFDAGRSQKLKAVRAHRMHLGIADSSGRQTPEPLDGGEFSLDADLAILALGFDPEDFATGLGAIELRTSRWGTVLVDHKSMMSNLDGVFAAGDAVRGASLVVWAIKDGRDAAESIRRYLENKAADQLAAAAE